MSILRPFRAVRPAEGLAPSIAALPYDVYTTEEARRAVEAAPLSFLRIDRAETQFPAGTDIYSPVIIFTPRPWMAGHRMGSWDAPPSTTISAV